MNERLIVSLTSYSKRIGNIPVVLETIFQQTVLPDFVVLNLAEGERIPEDVQHYIETHPIEILWGPATKVYKKLLPTLRKYPDDCVISIDDDFLYPKGMIEDFMTTHHKYPNCPISGNRDVYKGFQCHCGCASLMKLSYLGKYVDCIDERVMECCPSDDIVYSFFVNKNGHSYVRTHEMYFTNMKSYNEGEGYTVMTCVGKGINDSYSYLVKRFGKLDVSIGNYFENEDLKVLIMGVEKSMHCLAKEEGQLDVYSTLSYRIGHIILFPFKYMAKFFSKGNRNTKKDFLTD